MSALTATAIALTDEVEAAIAGGDWLRAAELEAQRRVVLEQLAAAGVAAGDTAATFAALLERNHRLMGLVRHQQRRVVREATIARSASNAIAAYAEAS